MYHLNDINRNGAYPTDKTFLTAIEENFKMITHAITYLADSFGGGGICIVLSFRGGTAYGIVNGNLAKIDYSETLQSNGYIYDFEEKMFAGTGVTKFGYTIEEVSQFTSLTGEDDVLYPNVLKQTLYKARPMGTGDYEWAFYRLSEWSPSLSEKANNYAWRKYIIPNDIDSFGHVNVFGNSMLIYNEGERRAEVFLAMQTKVAISGETKVIDFIKAHRSFFPSGTIPLSMWAATGYDVSWYAFYRGGEVYIVVRDGKSIPSGVNISISGILPLHNL